MLTRLLAGSLLALSVIPHPLPRGGDDDPPPADPPPGNPPPPPKTYDEEFVKNLQAQLDAGKKQADELAAKLKAIDDEKLSETEKLKKQAEDADARVKAAEERARGSLAKAATLAGAAKAGIQDPDVAFTLIRDSIEFDDNGDPKNVDKLLADLVKAKPYLLGAPSDDGNPGNPPRDNRGAGPLSLEAIKKMSPAEINKNWERVQQTLKQAGR